MQSVSFICLNRRVVYDSANVLEETPTDDPCAAIRKYLSSGSFYYADTFDLTQRVENMGQPRTSFHEQFVWNAYMLEPISQLRRRLDAAGRDTLAQSQFFVEVIQGYVGVRTVALGGYACRLALVSRLSSRKAGTRFNARGIDDEGNAANFVETETILSAGDAMVSFTQVRGSVPVFWEQQGLQALNARIQITRTGAASQPAFTRHMEQLLHEYRAVFLLDLLGTRDAEMLLGNTYVAHIEAFLAEHGDARLRYCNFDLHSVARSLGGLDGACAELDRMHNVQSERFANGCSVIQAGTVYARQQGVFRVNCFDCLDRTNVVEGCLSQSALQDAICRQDIWPTEVVRAGPSLLWAPHGELWAANGDALSVISTGTGSLNSTYMRTGSTKKSIRGMLSDAAKSASRMYVNNFTDHSKQEAIDMLLGMRSGQRQVELYDPVYARIGSDVTARRSEYTSMRTLRCLVGTYNVCAIAPTEDLTPWLVDAAVADVVVLCLQEVVPLTAQQMLQSAKDQVYNWERAALRQLDGFVSLRREIMFGTALLVFVRETTLPHVRRADAATRKTGFRGMSGNKGAVAVRLDIDDSSVCFVSAHLAAGGSNVDERNGDYSAIARDLCFPRGRTIDAHDYVFWAGDLNYRIDLSSEHIRECCVRRALGVLLPHDQLTRMRKLGAAFPGYEEAPIEFAPTYKYDQNTDTYDTSEKMRPPAWTDRVLFRAPVPESVRCIRYDHAPLRASDHRPVSALFEVEVHVVDVELRNAIEQALVEKYRGEAAPQRLPRGLATATSLPPASSDTEQWWNEDALFPDLGGDVRGNPFVRPVNVSAGRAPESVPVAPEVPARRPDMPSRSRMLPPDTSAPPLPRRLPVPPAPAPPADATPTSAPKVSPPASGTSASTHPISPPPIPARPPR